MAARGRAPKSKDQRKHEKERDSAAMARIFGAIEATREDAVRVQRKLQEICKTDERTSADGLNGLIELVSRAGKREVYLDIMDGINAGRRVLDEGGTTTVADSGGEG